MCASMNLLIPSCIICHRNSGASTVGHRFGQAFRVFARVLNPISVKEYLQVKKLTFIQYHVPGFLIKQFEQSPAPTRCYSCSSLSSITLSGFCFNVILVINLVGKRRGENRSSGGDLLPCKKDASTGMLPPRESVNS